MDSGIYCECGGEFWISNKGEKFYFNCYECKNKRLMSDDEIDNATKGQDEAISIVGLGILALDALFF